MNACGCNFHNVSAVSAFAVASADAKAEAGHVPADSLFIGVDGGGTKVITVELIHH